MTKYRIVFSLLLFFVGAAGLLDDLEKHKLEKSFRTQGETTEIIAFNHIEEKELLRKGDSSKPITDGFASAVIDFRSKDGERITVNHWLFSEQVLARVNNGERIEIEYLRDQPSTIRLAGTHASRGWISTILQTQMVAAGACLFFGMFKSKAYNRGASAPRRHARAAASAPPTKRLNKVGRDGRGRAWSTTAAHCSDNCWQVARSTGLRSPWLASALRWRSITDASFRHGAAWDALAL